MKSLLLLVFLCGCGFSVVDTGQRGVKVRFGEVISESLGEGLYFYNPFSSGIVKIDVREEKLAGKTECFTKDTQHVTIDYALTFYPDQTKIHELYKQYGRGWVEKLIPQVVLGSIKDVTGQYIADELVGKREVATKAAEAELKKNLVPRGIFVTRLDFTNLDFDDAYERAVEAKVVAIQKAAEAKNKTVEVEEHAKQVVKSAQADAEAMRIKSQALSQNKGLVSYEAVQKWNGILPQMIIGNGQIPMINLKGIGGQSE